MMMPFHNPHMLYGYDRGTYHPGIYGGKFCVDTGKNSSHWCTYGCCGHLNSQCCSANVAVMVGVSVLTLLLVCCIVAVCCCCVRCRRKASSGQVLGLHPSLPPPFSSVDGIDCTTMAATTSDTTTTTIPTGDQPLPYHTQAYPPGCYAPPAYSSLQHPSSSSSSSSSSSACQAYSAPIPPPPYTPMCRGLDNKAFKTAE